MNEICKVCGQEFSNLPAHAWKHNAHPDTGAEVMKLKAWAKSHPL